MSEDNLLQFMLASAEQRLQHQQQSHQQPLPPSVNSNWLPTYVLRKMRSDTGDNDELLRPLTDETMSPLDAETAMPDALSKPKYYSYMERFIQSRPDFYGPFWISSTLVFLIAILSNISSYVHYSLKSEGTDLSSQMSSNEHTKSSYSTQLDSWHYRVDELNMSSSLIMTYLALVPTFFWFIFWFRGCSKFYTLSEMICAYGYSLSIFIPLALMLINQTILVRYFMITVAATLSGSVLLLSLLPVAQSDPNPATSHIILGFVPLCQFGLAYIIHRIMLL